MGLGGGQVRATFKDSQLEMNEQGANPQWIVQGRLNATL